MKLADILNEAEIIELGRAEETALWRVIEKLANEESDELIKQIERNPRVNTEDARDDVRYKLALRAGLRRMMMWREQALEIITKGGQR